MKIVTLLCQKGGAGKTTVAFSLAVAAASEKRAAVLIDLDPQRSAESWGEARKTNHDKAAPFVVGAQANQIEEYVKTAKENKADYVFIDTAPHTTNEAALAARLADLIIIPCRTSALDLKAMTNSIEIANVSSTPHFVMLSAVPPQGNLGEQTAQALSNAGMPLCPVPFFQRSVHIHAAAVGLSAQEMEPKSKAADEVRALFNWTKKQLKSA